jgi:Flp pilus assembly protein TadD
MDATGGLLAAQRQFAEAAKAFREAAELDPTDVVSREALAQSLAGAGDRAAARREFEAVVAAKPNLGQAWLHYGQLLEVMGEPV